MVVKNHFSRRFLVNIAYICNLKRNIIFFAVIYRLRIFLRFTVFALVLLAAQVAVAQTDNDSLSVIQPEEQLLPIIDSIPTDTVLSSDTVSAVSDTIPEKKKKKETIEAPVVYQSTDSMVWIRGGNASLYGKSSVDYQNINLTSAIIRMAVDSSLVYADGVRDSLGNWTDTPVFKDGSTPYESIRMSYNFKTKKGYVCRFFDEVLLLQGQANPAQAGLVLQLPAQERQFVGEARPQSCHSIGSVAFADKDAGEDILVPFHVGFAGVFQEAIGNRLGGQGVEFAFRGARFGAVGVRDHPAAGGRSHLIGEMDDGAVAHLRPILAFEGGAAKGEDQFALGREGVFSRVVVDLVQSDAPEGLLEEVKHAHEFSEFFVEGALEAVAFVEEGRAVMASVQREVAVPPFGVGDDGGGLVELVDRVVHQRLDDAHQFQGQFADADEKAVLAHFSVDRDPIRVDLAGLDARPSGFRLVDDGCLDSQDLSF